MGSKTYLITGASKGIGRSIAMRLAKDGIQVVLLARQSEELEDAYREVQSLSPSSFMIACDLCSIGFHRYCNRVVQWN